jgi:hypothetical protein
MNGKSFLPAAGFNSGGFFYVESHFHSHQLPPPLSHRHRKRLQRQDSGLIERLAQRIHAPSRSFWVSQSKNKVSEVTTPTGSFTDSQ